MTDVTQAAQEGYDPTPDLSIKRCPYLFSSPSFYAFHAGQRLWALGKGRPVKATMGRGYSVNVSTDAARFSVRFEGDADLRHIVVTEIKPQG